MTGARSACRTLPEEPGVYRFRDDRGRVAYLGRATDLHARVRSYWGDLTDRLHLRRMITQVASVEAIVCASPHEAAWLERNLLERSLPRWNRIRGGTETPAWLVLDDGPRRPGLHLVFEAPTSARSVFGPYLGFEKATLARDGLLRLYPLHLTGSLLSRSDRSLADARGLSPEDRQEFSARIREVLTRDQDALARAGSALVALRDQASARLAFETAQQVQLELAALDWLVAEQRVTGCSPPDLKVVGWAEGTLFSLVATQGRLDRWTTRVADDTTGRRASARTPESWREFAVRNAELAATLAAAHRVE
jgi:excinuclease ABC subunit C